MRAWHVDAPGPLGGGPLRLRDDERPRPGPGELLLRVLACGVCRTDLHVVEGDLPPHLPGVTPGHEVVGEVAALGEAAEGFAVGDRAGAAWLRWTDGSCRYCRRGAENLCPNSRYTGWDANGGYAEYMTVPAGYAYRLPPGYSDLELAPLLCAGIIGYHALKRAELPPGGRLGLYGFGGSAHLAAQVALAQGATVHVLTRREPVRARGRAGAARHGGARPRRHPGHRRHLPERHPAAELRAPPVPGAADPQRHLQHPRGRPGVPRLRRPAQAGRHRARVPAGPRGPGAGGPEGRPLRRCRGADCLTPPLPGSPPPAAGSLTASPPRPAARHDPVAASVDT